MPKWVALDAVLAIWMFGASGCVRQSEYDAKVAELKGQTEQTVKVEQKVLGLQKNLDTAKDDIAKAKQEAKDAEIRIKAFEQQVTDLKTKVQEQTSQFQKDLDAAKKETEKVEQARKDTEAEIQKLEEKNADLKNLVQKLSKDTGDLSGAWEISYRDQVRTVMLEPLPNNRYRLGPKNLAYHGVYEFDGKTLSMVGENPGYPDLVWSMKKPGLFEMVTGNYLVL